MCHRMHHNHIIITNVCSVVSLGVRQVVILPLRVTHIASRGHWYCLQRALVLPPGGTGIASRGHWYCLQGALVLPPGGTGIASRGHWYCLQGTLVLPSGGTGIASRGHWYCLQGTLVFTLIFFMLQIGKMYSKACFVRYVAWLDISISSYLVLFS